MWQIIIDSSASAEPISGVLFSPGPALFVVLILIIALIAWLFINKFIRLLRRPELSNLTPERVAQMWAQVVQTSGQGLIGAKLAVMEADKLLDSVLKSMMFPGETMADRLRLATYKYPKINHVWPAHKLRNQLVHDSTFELTARQAAVALRDFKNALKTLNVL